MKKHKISPEVKEQIINRIKNEGITVIQASKDHGVNENTIYTWISKKVVIIIFVQKKQNKN